MSRTIVALATPYGRSGIGVIRLSGEQSLEIIRKLTRDTDFLPSPRRAYLKKIFDLQTADVLDEALITYFQSPQSFTGEDVVEISCHGSPVLLRQTIDLCLRLDARLAEPGEFSLRALSNGRMDLSQAEAIRDLIDARTVASARQAVRQLGGELSSTLQTLKNELLNVIVVLESTLEFVEDDLPDFQYKDLCNKLERIVSELDKLISSFRAGKLLREGLTVVLAGRPNVGKSSIFNALVGQSRAIVTEIAGTTRDSLHESLTIQNIPVLLIDTAGLRETTDAVESIGVVRTKKIMADADLVIVVLDSSQELSEEDLQVLEEAKGSSHFIVLNKIDLPQRKIEENSLSSVKLVFSLSASTGQGLDVLQNAIVKPFLPEGLNESNLLISDARHFDLFRRAKAEIESSISLLDQRFSEEIVLVGLHNAMRLFGEVTGETTTEDMLTRIFSTFCIGK